MKKVCLTCFFAAMSMLPLWGGEILLQSGFDSPEEFSRWRKISGWSHSVNGGRNGTGAAVLTRKEFSGPLSSIKLDSLKPGVLYRLTVWVRTENLESDGKSRNFGAFCVEFVRNGKWVSGFYPLAAKNDGKWQKYKLEFMRKPDVDQTSIVLYIRKGFKGTLYFDDVVLEEAGDPKAAILVTAPSQLTFMGTSGELRISGSSSDPGKKQLDIKISGPEYSLVKTLTETSPGEFLLPLSGLNPGEYILDMKLSGEAGKKMIHQGQQKLFVRTGGKKKSSFDEAGNLYVDGKKIMPIGIFGGFAGNDDLKKISAAGFNVILNYSSFGMSFGGGGKNRMETLGKALDEIQKHGLKLLFSLKDQYAGMRYALTSLDDASGIDAVVKRTVSSLKDHPALFGWYVSDENSRSELPQMLALRQLISSVDHDHPTITLTFREGDLPLYGISGDVVAVDNYPILRKDEKDLSPLIKLIKNAKSGKQPVWMVPQIFNWGVYRAKNVEEFAAFVYPEEKEIKAMIAVSAALGCKGFIFYSYSDIFGERGKKYFPENCDKQWENTVAAVAMLKKLEPFILSTSAPEIITDNGKELVAGFRNDEGKKALVAVRTDLGESNLVLPVQRDYQLIDGCAVSDGKNWVFTGKDIDFCILMER
ncbi:MAG: hypothetical protein E7043_08925 [Lentisphaerae bacterium]|nr:hypothetical protein [Lentisphaerota bacterium]